MLYIIEFGLENIRPNFTDIEKAEILYNQRKEKYKLISDYIIDGNLEIHETALIIADIWKKIVKC